MKMEMKDPTTIITKAKLLKEKNDPWSMTNDQCSISKTPIKADEKVVIVQIWWPKKHQSEIVGQIKTRIKNRKDITDKDKVRSSKRHGRYIISSPIHSIYPFFEHKHKRCCFPRMDMKIYRESGTGLKTSQRQFSQESQSKQRI